MEYYIALLRGINVGGKALIKMADLRQCIEALGFKRVQTYIQSGNVLFAAPRQDLRRLTGSIERALASTFSCAPKVALLTYDQLGRTVQAAPKDFGKDARFRYNVIFLLRPTTAQQALEVIRPREGVDQLTVAGDVLFVRTLLAERTKSTLPRVMGTPLYKSMTIRNWNTTKKLHELMQRLREG
jgi:uncharacterized protein (DUF1697 family)